MPTQTHCPYCGMFVTEIVPSFCRSCLESLPEVENRWFSTKEFNKMDNDSCFTH